MRLLGALPLQALLLVSTLILPTVVASPTNAIEKRAPKEEPKKEQNEEKYFHEAGTTDQTAHYDIRFFKDLVPYEEHRMNLRLLIRSYLSVFRELGVETWLAHGTLLGWWWNGRIMPWDYDLDVQVSSATLFYLEEKFNRTEHQYNYVDELTGKRKTKTYLLDINPSHKLPRLQGKNIIDARWIDTANGMFVDITGISEREPETQPGIWSCKNFHRYRTRDLYPMRETEYEGVPATVPYNFDRILKEEYGVSSLVTTEWQGYDSWLPQSRAMRTTGYMPECVQRRVNFADPYDHRHRWSADLKEWIKILKDEKKKINHDD